MVTLQEQFEKDFPNKSVREINAEGKYQKADFTNYDLDLREYKDLSQINLDSNKITSIKKLEAENNKKTLYQKYTEKYGKK